MCRAYKYILLDDEVGEGVGGVDGWGGGGANGEVSGGGVVEVFEVGGFIVGWSKDNLRWLAIWLVEDDFN